MFRVNVLCLILYMLVWVCCDINIELFWVEIWKEMRWETLIISCVTYIGVRCISTLIVNYLELNVDVRLMRSVDNIGCYVHWMKYIWHWYWIIWSWILMRDLVRNFDNIVCEVYWVELWWGLEENFGDIVRYVYWKSSAGCWSKA